jgi:hypothetical protein
VFAVEEAIRFYRTGDEYGFLSNFAPYPIDLDGKRWPTSEHYFQAHKFAGIDYAEAIRIEKSPLAAAKMRRSRVHPVRSDWEDARVEIMRRAVRSKFEQYAELKSLLLATGAAEIIEHTENDSYWGDGGNGSGKNLLGVILMQVREELRRASSP